MEDKKKHITDFFSKLDFNSEKHLYQYKERQLYSVSSIIKRYVEPFDAKKVAGFVARNRGISKAEVLAEWEEKKNKACDKGNRVHLFGEVYPETKDIALLEPTDGYEEAVVNFWASLPKHIEPFLFELQMFSEELGIAGTADIILYNRNTGKFIIADYKTNIDLFKNYRGKKMLPPFQMLLDNPYNKYQLQLSMYQHLFEQCGFEVEKRVLVWLKPNGTFEPYETKNLILELLNTL